MIYLDLRDLQIFITNTSQEPLIFLGSLIYTLALLVRSQDENFILFYFTSSKCV